MVKAKVQLPPSPSVVAKNGKVVPLDRNSHQVALSVEVAYSIVHIIPGRVRFRVPRLIHDANFAQQLQTVLEAEAQVTRIRINRDAASVAITYESSTSDAKMRLYLVRLLQKAGGPVILTNSKSSSQQAATHTTSSQSALKLSALATTLAFLGGPLGLPIPAVIVAGTIVVAALPVAQRAVAGVREQRRLNIDFLDLMAITITTLQGNFLTPSLMLGLIEIGDHIRERTAQKSKLQTLNLLDSLSACVWVERDGQKQQVSIHEVQPGDTVIVYPGEQVPIDGRILRGKALLDEQKLTGESMPVVRNPGQAVYASTLVREGRIYILVERVGNDTRAGQSIQLMQAAPVHDTRIENYAAKIADKAVMPTLLLGGLVFAATRNPARAASVLTLDFATGIRVSVPTTVLAALTYAARRGILIRSGRALEQLAQVDTIVFDKTGTLTEGEVTVIGVKSMNPLTPPTRVLELAAAAEQRLTHPVAAAVMRYAQSQAVSVMPRGKWDYHLGLGVQAQVDGQLVQVGSDRFLRQVGIDLRQHRKLSQTEETSAIYVASNGELQGKIEYSDVLRPESRDVIAMLRTVAGVEIHLLTGDKWQTANAVASELGIPETHTHAEAFPEQKATVVRQLHEQGKTVAFVGDGINDSPALAYADVSISFAHGSDIARETADIVLMQNDLQGLVEAIAIARKAKQLIHQNTAIVAIPNLAAMALAAVFGISPLAATIVNNGSTVAAGLNGLRQRSLKVVS
ncbi:MAG: cadmium-translocating P-type ATPase [Chroococcidiopsidaceae cyanobacterium CP_BM_ER_R8_30]|nr:cadmium-translocating P-type ATPase [Chroococcidiopsidaceae cyanobacterium CP_BM_ER_R8_30]